MKSHYRFICHKIIEYVYMHIQWLLKSHDDIHDVTYRIKIMLSGIAIIKHSISRYYKYYYLKMKNGQRGISICLQGVYPSVYKGYIHLFTRGISICLQGVYPSVYKGYIHLFTRGISICLQGVYPSVYKGYIHLFIRGISICLQGVYPFVYKGYIHLFIRGISICS